MFKLKMINALKKEIPFHPLHFVFSYKLNQVFPSNRLYVDYINLPLSLIP